jgi:hypothetical protein
MGIGCGIRLLWRKHQGARPDSRIYGIQMKGGLVRTGGEEAYEDYGKEEKEGAKTTGRSTAGSQGQGVSIAFGRSPSVHPSVHRSLKERDDVSHRHDGDPEHLDININILETHHCGTFPNTLT